MCHHGIGPRVAEQKGPRSLREAEAEGLVLFCVIVQDRGDRTRVAALCARGCQPC